MCIFRCEKSNKCIDESLVCDDKADCIYMEDEADCTKQCEWPAFLCPDGSGCYMQCDGIAQCADESDELECDYQMYSSIDEFFESLHCQLGDFKCQVNDFVGKMIFALKIFFFLIYLIFI